jgi:hypothetical protein
MVSVNHLSESTVLFRPKYSYKLGLKSNLCRDRAIAQEVSRWLPTAAARVRVRAGCGICCGQSGAGADFLRVLRFPLADLHFTNFSTITITYHPGLVQ